MGTTVLDAGFANRAGMHVYAHCLRGVPGGVAMLVLNTDRQKSSSLTLPAAAASYTLTAASLTDKTISLNRTPLRLGPNDALPMMAAQATAVGKLAFAPASITFLAIPEAANAACAANKG
jgi:heparanase 1